MDMADPHVGECIAHCSAATVLRLVGRFRHTLLVGVEGAGSSVRERCAIQRRDGGRCTAKDSCVNESLLEVRRPRIMGSPQAAKRTHKVPVRSTLYDLLLREAVRN